jgi:hypothetical protein
VDESTLPCFTPTNSTTNYVILVSGNRGCGWIPTTASTLFIPPPRNRPFALRLPGIPEAKSERRNFARNMDSYLSAYLLPDTIHAAISLSHIVDLMAARRSRHPNRFSSIAQRNLFVILRVGEILLDELQGHEPIVHFGKRRAGELEHVHFPHAHAAVRSMSSPRNS